MGFTWRGRSISLLATVLMTWSAYAQDEQAQAPWKHRIGFPDDPFQSWTAPPYVKFTIITKDGYDPNLVYYQDSSQYEYHFDFALERLEPFIGMSLEEFDSVTLHAAGQRAVLGAVILPPWHDPPFAEYGIQFARIDPYPREEVVRYFNQVKATVAADPNVRAYYFPTYEQYLVAQQNREWFEARGVPIGSTSQWSEGNASYSQGWALGMLKFVRGGEIQQAYTAGALSPDDILLTDGVPAEVPSLAGIVTLAPSTPNSHVAILARSQGVPFVHLAVESDAARATSLIGHDVYLAVAQSEFGSSCTVKLLDIASLDETARAALLALKKAPPLVIQPMATRGQLWADTNDLHPSDIRFFGGKASNFGVLRRAFPGDSPRAMAFSFDLWNAFLDQRLPAAPVERTLREEIGRRLAQYTSYPPADREALAADLASIRVLFTDSEATQFGAMETLILGALQDFGFDPSRNIRFRSSTNVEDSDQFTGAGLYDSFSGCLADDLDGDSAGPCACDSSEGKERGVFRAIRRVLASFYNDNAFLERLKHDVNETEVGMALLVHHSFPDEIELANGVATLERSYDRGWSASVVSQKGAVSVTNPPLDAVPEEVRIDAGFFGPMPQIVRRSSLVPLRENTVLAWEAEYLELYDLLVTAAGRYCEETGKEDIVLDFEFKKTAPEGRLVVKQIREIPRAGSAEYVTPLLLAQPKTYWTLQGRGGDVFANHRLKSRWTLTPKSVWLSEESWQDCVYDGLTIEFIADGQTREVCGALSLLPEVAHGYEPPPWEFGGYSLIDSWRFPDLGNPRTYRLRTTSLYPPTVADPVVTLDDFRAAVTVEYQDPVPTDSSAARTTTTDEVSLYQPWQPADQDEPEECSFEDPNLGVSIRTRFYSRWGWGWDSPTSVQFESTRIEGLTTEPIVLTGYFSQSVGGGAHLCPKNFLFEPGLEPGISQQTLDELRVQNIRLIYFTTGARECRPTEWRDTPPAIRFLGFDEPIE